MVDSQYKIRDMCALLEYFDAFGWLVLVLTGHQTIVVLGYNKAVSSQLLVKYSLNIPLDWRDYLKIV